MKKKVLVIGAGIGGSAVAIYLAQQGCEVEVLEKQRDPGGRCGQIRRDGHRFDLGATLMLMPTLFRSIYADWGEDLDQHLKLFPLDPIYEIDCESGNKLAFTSRLPALQTRLEAVEKGSFRRWLRYFELGCRQYGELMHRFLGRNFDAPWEFFNPANAYYFLTLKAHRNHFNYAKKIFRSPELRAAFTFQNIYVGQSPYSSSATYTLLPAMELAQGGWYPQGGMHSVAQSLVNIAGRHGVRFRFNAPVERIRIKNSTATGVVLNDGTELEADIVVSNADLPYTYAKLLPDAARAARLRRKRYTCSAIVFHWGLDRTYPELGHHNIFLSADYRGGFDGIFKHRTFGETPHFYLNRPSHTDPSAAPAGRDSFSVIIPSGHLEPRRPRDWDELSRRAREAVFRRLRKNGLDEVEKNIRFEIRFTPPVWERSLNLTYGSVFGSLDHGIGQVGYLRPANRHARYRNVYFVGGSTHPGSGVPLVLLSGRLTAERILRDLGRSRPFARELMF